MKTLLTVGLCACLLVGCASVKLKRHGVFCVGACIHVEGSAEKSGGGPPEKPAPDANEEPDKG